MGTDVDHRHANTHVEAVDTGVVHADAEKVGRVVETDAVTREVRDVKGAAAVQSGVAAEHEGIEVGKVGEAPAPVAEITETETTEREVRSAAAGAEAEVAVPAPAPKTTGIETGVINDTDRPVARVVEKETAVSTGVMDAQAREVGEVVETATVHRNIVPTKGPKIDLPLDDASISTNKDTATLNIGTVGQAS